MVQYVCYWLFAFYCYLQQPQSHPSKYTESHKKRNTLVYFSVL